MKPIVLLVLSSAVTTSAQAAINWRVHVSDYPTQDLPVYALKLGDPVYPISANPNFDYTNTLQAMANELHLAGGGIMFIPPGSYRVDGRVTIDIGVTVRGEWRLRDDGSVEGTVIRVTDRNEGQPTPSNGTFHIVGHGACVRDLVFWYPDQAPDNVQPYPPSISVDRDKGRIKPAVPSVLNIHFVNSYVGVYLDKASNPTIGRLSGSPLGYGVRTVEFLGGISNVYSFDFSPRHWASSGLPGSPQPSSDGSMPHAAYMRQHGIGTTLAANESLIEGYHTGGDGLLGAVENLTIRDCEIAATIDVARTGMTNCFFQGTTAALTGKSPNQLDPEYVSLHTCTLDGPVYELGPGIGMFTNCTFTSTLTTDRMSFLQVAASRFTHPATPSSPHVVVAAGTRAAFAGCSFTGPAEIQIKSQVAADVVVDPLPVEFTPLRAVSFNVMQHRRPASNQLVVITDSPYSADVTGVADAAPAIRAAIASLAYGGVVLVPPGRFRIDSPITVPQGVELRGSWGGPHSPQGDFDVNRSFGSTLVVTHARSENQPPAAAATIQLAGGLRGLSLRYEQRFLIPNPPANPSDYVPFALFRDRYPFTIQGTGPAIWANDLSCAGAYDFIDFGSHRCDDHLIEHVNFWAANQGIRLGGGSVGGRVQWGLSKEDGVSGAGERDVETWGAEYRSPIIVGDVRDQLIYNIYARGTFSGLHAIAQNGRGPDVVVIQGGGESNHNGLIVDPDAGTATIHIRGWDIKANRGIVDVASDGRYVRGNAHTVLARLNEPASGHVHISCSSLAGMDTAFAAVTRHANVTIDGSKIGGSRFIFEQSAGLQVLNSTFPAVVSVEQAGPPAARPEFVLTHFAGLFLPNDLRALTATRWAELQPQTELLLRTCFAPVAAFWRVFTPEDDWEMGIRAVVDHPATPHVYELFNEKDKGDDPKSAGKDVWLWTLKPVDAETSVTTQTLFDVFDAQFAASAAPSASLFYEFYAAAAFTGGDNRYRVFIDNGEPDGLPAGVFPIQDADTFRDHTMSLAAPVFANGLTGQVDVRVVNSAPTRRVELTRPASGYAPFVEPADPPVLLTVRSRKTHG